jgi:hypothetical protein
MHNPNDLRKKKAELKEAAAAILNPAMAAGRDLTADENAKYNEHVTEMKSIESLLAKHAELSSFGSEEVSNERPVIVRHGRKWRRDIG